MPPPWLLKKKKATQATKFLVALLTSKILT